MLAILLESTETRCMLFFDADEATKDRMRQPLLKVPKAAVRRIRCKTPSSIVHAGSRAPSSSD